MEEFDAAVQALGENNPLLRAWMSWMMIVSFSSLLFVWKHIPARFALASVIGTFLLALPIFHYTGKVHLIGIAHMIFWIPLAYYLIKKEGVTKTINLKKPYSIWVNLFLATICISLLFDFRDVIMVFMGMK